MTNKWKKIILTSLLAIAVEIIALIFVVLPFYKVKRVYDSIDAGRWKDAKERYAKLDSSKQKAVQKNLDNYAAYIDKKYVDGDVDYATAAASLDALGAIDETELIKMKYIEDINERELDLCIRELCDVSKNYDTKRTYELNAEIASILRRMKGDVKEKALIKILNMYYKDYLDEKVTFIDVHNCAGIVSNLCYYEAYEYCNVILYNANVVMQYRQMYTVAESELASQNYAAVLDICTMVVTDPRDTNYRKKFDDLAVQAKAEGVEFYRTKLDGYIAEGKKNRAIELLDSIEKYFGEELNLDSIKNDLASDWQMAYLSLIEDLESNLKRDIVVLEEGNNILSDFDNLRPDSLLLKDINGDLIPEVFFFNSASVDNTYVGCFIYGYVDGNYSLLGLHNVRNFGDGSYLITSPTSYGREEGDEYCLLRYDGVGFEVLSYCQELGDSYSVDGESVSNADYLSGRKFILDHAGEGSIKTSKYKGLEDAQKYILSY